MKSTAIFKLMSKHQTDTRLLEDIARASDVFAVIELWSSVLGVDADTVCDLADDMAAGYGIDPEVVMMNFQNLVILDNGRRVILDLSKTATPVMH